MELPTLSGEALTLRPKRADDVDALVEACQDPEIPRWTLVPSPYRREHAEQYLLMSGADARADRAVSLLAVDDDDRLLGSISLMELDRAPGYGEIGYWVAAPARGRGVASRAVRLLHRWAVESLGLACVEILCHEENRASLRVALKAGFTDTGERRRAPRGGDTGAPRYLVLRRDTF